MIKAMFIALIGLFINLNANATDILDVEPAKSSYTKQMKKLWSQVESENRKTMYAGIDGMKKLNVKYAEMGSVKAMCQIVYTHGYKIGLREYPTEDINLALKWLTEVDKKGLRCDADMDDYALIEMEEKGMKSPTELQYYVYKVGTLYSPKEISARFGNYYAAKEQAYGNKKASVLNKKANNNLLSKTYALVPETEEPVANLKSSKMSDLDYLKYKKNYPEFAQADSELCKAFSRAIKTVGTAEKKELKADQNRWIVSRDKRLAETAEPFSKGYVDLLVQLTKERSNYFNSMQN